LKKTALKHLKNNSQISTITGWVSLPTQLKKKKKKKREKKEGKIQSLGSVWVCDFKTCDLKIAILKCAI
jgi:hypothetical protein